MPARTVIVTIAVAGCSTRAEVRSPSALDPPPPAGVIVPAIGEPRCVSIKPDGGYLWRGTFDVPADDPRVIAEIKKHDPHDRIAMDLARRNEAVTGKPWRSLTPGQAGAALYLEQAHAAGVATDDTGYVVAGRFDVIVVADRTNDCLTPSSFEVLVSPPGG